MFLYQTAISTFDPQQAQPQKILFDATSSATGSSILVITPQSDATHDIKCTGEAENSAGHLLIPVIVGLLTRQEAPFCNGFPCFSCLA